jgi:hypothetical protein
MVDPFVEVHVDIVEGALERGGKSAVTGKSGG